MADVVAALRRHLQSGSIGNIPEKIGYIERLEAHEALESRFEPSGTGWGASPLNPNTWKRLDGSDLIPDFKTKRARKTFRAGERKEIAKKTNNHCYSCGMDLGDLTEMWVEHIVPFSRGGSDELDNLLPSCRLCNYTRQNFTPHHIQRILSVGSVTVREVDAKTELGEAVVRFLEKEDLRRKRNRKHDGRGFLVYRAEHESEQGAEPDL